MRTVMRPEVKLERPRDPISRMPKLLTDRRGEKRSPGPSRLRYRLARLWKKRWLRRSAMVLLPMGVFCLAVWQVGTDPAFRSYVAERKADAMTAISERPEFAISGLRISGASAKLAQEIEAVVALVPDASSLETDIGLVQARVAAMPAIKSAQVTLGADKMLDVRVRERHAEALWRDLDGGLWLVDREGVSIAPAVTRAGYPTLPVVIGQGAPDRMAEALAVFRAAPDLHPRVRALVRVGERRWNVVLDRGLTVFLPVEQPELALGRVMAWHYGEQLLDRGVSVIDMRQSDRPIIRMTPEAAESYRVRQAAGEEGEET